MDLAGAARELYALAPEEFTAARNAKAKEAASAGKKDLAARLKALRKPSAAAWLVNMLTRHRGEEVAAVLELGRAMSQAQDQLNAGALRTLGPQRRDLLAAIATQARDVAGELGHPVSTAALVEVESTLHAAMADPAAGEAVASGLLLDSLSSNGLDPVDLEGKVAIPGATALLPKQPRPKTQHAKTQHPKTQGPGRTAPEAASAGAGSIGTGTAERESAAAQRRRARAQAGLERAAKRLQDADGARQEAQRRLEQLAGERGGLEERIADHERQLASLRRELASVEREAARASDGVEGAARAAGRAREALEKARRSLAVGT